MYEVFFGLKRRPFLAVPDTESYFSTEPMEEAFRSIERTVRRGEGIALLFGTSGTGKTLLLRLLRDSLKTNYTTSIISNGHLETPKSFLQQLLYELQLPFSNGDEIELRFQLLNFARQNKTCVILIDESQFLSSSVLEEIRLLMNCDNGSVPFFRVVLAGNIEFEEKLTEPYLHAFNQRVVCRAYLETFSREETRHYITWQTDVFCQQDDLFPASASGLAEWIEHSGGSEGRRIDSPHIKYSEPIFTENAKQLIFQLTDGLPRSINQLCDTALHTAAERILRQIDEHLVHYAWTQLQQITGHSEENETESISATLISPSFENIDEIVARKKATFQPKTFNSAVEFGTLDDTEIVEPAENELTESEPAENENATIICFRSPNGYKPPYPEDDHWEENEEKNSKPEIPPLVLFETKISEQSEQSEPNKIETENNSLPIIPQPNIEQKDYYSEETQEVEENPLEFYDVLENEILFSSDIFPRLRELPISEEWDDTIEAVAEAVTEKTIFEKFENTEVLQTVIEEHAEQNDTENIEVSQTITEEFSEQNITENIEVSQTVTEEFSEQNITENIEVPQTVTEEYTEQIVAENVETPQTATKETVEKNIVSRSSKRIYPFRRQQVKEISARKYRHRTIISTVSTRTTETSEQSCCLFCAVSIFLTFRRFDSNETWIGNFSFYPLLVSVRFPMSFRRETVNNEAVNGETIIGETIINELESNDIVVTDFAVAAETGNNSSNNNEPISDEVLVDLNRENCSEESEMDKETLKKYGAEILDGRPPFVRKEPNYAYQTTDFVPEMVGKVSYPDFVTGNVLLLNWMETEHNSDNGFGTTYREFLTRDFLEKQDIDKLQTDFQEKQYSYNEFDSLQVVRAALNQVTDIPQSFLVSQSQKTSLDELFDEVVVVEPLAVPLKEPSDRSISSRPIFPNDFSVPAQIEAAVRRITKAAEKIEQAAEQSNGAGQQIKQAACFIETEIKTKLPAYVELFQELTEFQQMISRELNTKRSENQITKEPLTREPPKHQNQNQQERPVRLLPFPVRLNNGSTGSAQFVPEIKMPSATDESTLNEKSIDFQSLFQ